VPLEGRVHGCSGTLQGYAARRDHNARSCTLLFVLFSDPTSATCGRADGPGRSNVGALPAQIAPIHGASPKKRRIKLATGTFAEKRQLTKRGRACSAARSRAPPAVADCGPDLTGLVGWAHTLSGRSRTVYDTAGDSPDWPLTALGAVVGKPTGSIDPPASTQRDIATSIYAAERLLASTDAEIALQSESAANRIQRSDK
jgi:hypothetical protein